MNKTNSFWIGGIHSVIAAIQNKSRKIRQVITTEKFLELEKLKVNYKIVDKKKIIKIFKDQEFQFQNIAAEIDLLERKNLEEEVAKQKIKNIIILDGVNDPRNIGSIVRTSVAFNIDAIILKDRDFKATSATMYKSACGGMELINIFEVINLNHAINLLKKNNFWIYGLDHEAKSYLKVNQLSDKNAYIFGAEGDGISKKIKEKCDYLIKLKTNPNMQSLNVSNAVSATLSVITNNLF
jgi:23S rRNA (guanosine2251-2'-O)-methyltransferase